MVEKEYDYVTIKIKRSTLDKLERCKQQYLQFHPEMKRIKLSYDAKFNIVLDFYEEN